MVTLTSSNRSPVLPHAWCLIIVESLFNYSFVLLNYLIVGIVELSKFYKYSSIMTCIV